MEREPTAMELQCVMDLRRNRASRGEGGAIITQHDMDDVRAVICAMREPTYEMLDAAPDNFSEPGAFAVWTAMVDVASPSSEARNAVIIPPVRREAICGEESDGA